MKDKLINVKQFEMLAKIHSSVRNISPRGGSTIIEVNGRVIMFGGADREQTAFQDMMVYDETTGNIFRSVTTSGDVPMPRSGHAVVSYGKYMLLYGGIDFAEEAVYNDLYLLDTEASEWSYVGESGVEVVARNSHSFGIVADAVRMKSYLVIYGGASPEHGPLGDTLYAEIPVDPSTIDSKSFFVQWELLKIPSTATVFTGSAMDDSQPGAREMHGTCSIDGAMLISGGRSDRGLLSDVWILQSNNDIDSSETIAALEPSDGYPVHSRPLLWRRCSDLELSSGLCSHGASIIAMPREVDSLISANSSPSVNSNDLSDIADGNKDTVPKHDRYAFVVTGGFSGDGISDTVMVINLHSDLTGSRASSAEVGSAINSCQWTSIDLDARLEGRFGSAVCCLSRRTCHQLVNNPKYASVFNAALKSRINESILESTSIERDATRGKWSDSSPVAALIFGGVCIEKDFGDLHLLLL